jgi:hypothetical protein
MSNENLSEEPDFEGLRKPIQDIISLTETLNEKYREKAFEILLNFYLHKRELKVQPTPEIAPVEEKEKTPAKEALIPIDVRAFLQQNEVPEESISKLFLIEKELIRPIYKITTIKKATAQIQIALLTALENALQKQGNKFEFSVEDIRKRCQDKVVYDGPNFKGNFKNNQKLFKSIADEEHIELSPEGQTELAEVITTVSK